MASLNDMVLQLSSTNDTKKKLTIGQDIIDYLGQPENSVECDDLGGFIDTLVPFMQSSNFKVFMFIIKFVLFCEQIFITNRYVVINRYKYIFRFLKMDLISLV